MAAAFMRVDASYARELADEFRKRCEAEGREKERREMVRRAQYDMEVYREGDAWFVTKDGLKTKDKIKPSLGHSPPEWQRACHKSPGDFVVAMDAPCNYEPIEIRTYRREEWGKDGLPVYKEV
jgi:hypothetical protein